MAQFEQPHLIDLNKATIDHDGCVFQLNDYPHRQHCHVIGETTYVFADHTRLLCDEIRKWPVIIGCVAWLTNKAILTALQGREVSIIVQKEDWLRPDTDNWTMQKQRYQYELLTGIQDKYAFGAGYNQCGDPDMDPVVCCGMLNTPGNIVARMHHKFLVFGFMLEREQEVAGHEEWGPVAYSEFVPRKVWTGSFNMTGNAERSLENAQLIDNAEVAAVFTQEWMTVLGLTEPLNWNATYVATNMRVGT